MAARQDSTSAFCRRAQAVTPESAANGDGNMKAAALPRQRPLQPRLPRQRGRVTQDLIGTPSGAQIPIEEVARISFSAGPPRSAMKTAR